VRRALSGIAAAAATLVVSVSAQTLKYNAPITFSTGSARPVYIAAGDFDGDGKQDIVVPDSSGKSISVFLNAGNGTFGPAVITTLNIINSTGAILVGDWNEDGKQDILVATVAGSQLAIPLLGNGDGTFQEQPGIPNSFGFLSGQVADFNGDGHLDAFLGGNGQPYLFFGRGDSSFIQQSVPSGSFPGDYFSVAVGDINGDKVLDVVGADTGDPGGSTGGSIDIFPGQAGGGFASPSFYPSVALAYPESVELADFNLDHKLDLLVSTPNGVFIALGNGDGTLKMQLNDLILISFPSSPSATLDSFNALAADLNGDGKPDVVALDGTTGTLTLALNEGAGAFPNALSSPYVYQLGANSFRMVAADFNGDGLPDLAVANSTGKFVSVLLSMRTVSAPTITLTASGNSLLVGSTLAFQVQVSGADVIPTGSVTLLDGSTAMGTQQLNASGAVTFSTSSLSAGPHALTATYSGDGSFNASTSSVLNESVTDFEVALSPPSQTVAAGASATYALALTPVGGFNGDVTITCSGLPSLAECQSASATVGANPTAVNVVVTTAASITAMNRVAAGSISACAALGGLLFLFGIKGRRAFIGLVAMLLIFCSVGLSGCGGGGSQKTVPGTPAGSTTFTITATATQNGVTVTHTSNATLVVQ
jgi:hypothetical protein